MEVKYLFFRVRKVEMAKRKEFVVHFLVKLIVRLACDIAIIE